MSLIKNLLARKSTLFIFLAAILFIITMYASVRSNKLSKELGLLKANSEKFSQENLEVKNNYVKIQNDYNKLQSDLEKTKKELEAALSEQERLGVQSKGLLLDRDRARELEALAEKNKSELENLEKAKQELITNNLTLKDKIKDLETLQKQLLKEKDALRQALESSKEKSGLKRLEDQNAALKNENTKVIENFKSLKQELNKSRDSEAKANEEIKKLNAKLDDLGDKYELAVKKNKEFEKRVTETPVKFAQLAHQNQVLIKQTSNMHYNMGVFYTRQKEYSRAVAEYEKALELTPGDAYSHFNLGYIYAEYLVDRPKAIEHFRQYLRYAKKEDKDVDWVKKYIITWQSWQGRETLE